MRKKFFYLTKSKNKIDYKKLKNNNILLIPILNNKKEIIDIKKLDENLDKANFENTILIMAGGFGKRMRPYTNTKPKPMLKISGKPILENIIDQFITAGFSDFIISTHYKARVIENYFKDGSNFGIKIRYVREKKPLGTAGSLGKVKKEEFYFSYI